MTLLPINGKAVKLKPQENATSEQIVDGYMALMVQNSSASTAQWIWVSGGNNAHSKIDGNTSAPQPTVHNWAGNKLTVTNTSPQGGAEIEVALFSPGQPDFKLEDGSPVTLDQLQTCAGPTKANLMQLLLNAGNNEYRTFVLFTASSETPTTYCVNAPNPKKVPGGYTKQTADNTFPVINNWLGTRLYAVNSSFTPGSAKVTLTDLG